MMPSAEVHVQPRDKYQLRKRGRFKLDSEITRITAGMARGGQEDDEKREGGILADACGKGEGRSPSRN